MARAFFRGVNGPGAGRIERIGLLSYKRLTIKSLHWKAYIHVGLVNPDPYVILGAGASVPCSRELKK